MVDGYGELTRTVYKFLGCLRHGCLKCFPDHQKYSKLNPNRTFQELYAAALAKSDSLRERYSVTVIWECQWGRQVKTNPDLRQFLNTLERRHTFCKRTNATTLYYRTQTKLEPNPPLEDTHRHVPLPLGQKEC